MSSATSLALRRRGLGARSVARTSVGAARPVPASCCARERSSRDPTEQLESPRPPRRLPRTLSVEDVAALVETPDTDAAGRPARPRHARAAVRLGDARLRGASPCGWRTSTSRRGYVVCTGKGSRQRLVPVGRPGGPAGCGGICDRGRRAALKRRDPGTLFLNRSGRPLSRQALWEHPQAGGAPGRAARRRCRPTPCATPSRATCSSAAPTCGRCRPCSGTPTSRRRRSTRICPRRCVRDMYRQVPPARGAPPGAAAAVDGRAAARGERADQ